MKEIIFRDIKSMKSSFRFWAAVGIIVVSTIINILSNMWGQGKISVGDLFIIGNISSNPIMCFFAAFIPAIAFGPVVIDDIKSGAYDTTTHKIGLKKYIGGRIVSSVIAGCSVFLIAFLIILAGCFLFGSQSTYSSYSPLGLFKDVYYFSVNMYILLFILHSMLFGAVYALLGMGIAITTRSDSMSLVLPGIIYNCSNLVGMIFENTPINIVDKIIPVLTYEFGSLDTPLWRNMLDLGEILVISIILILIGYRRLERSSEMSLLKEVQ